MCTFCDVVFLLAARIFIISSKQQEAQEEAVNNKKFVDLTRICGSTFDRLRQQLVYYINFDVKAGEILYAVNDAKMQMLLAAGKCAITKKFYPQAPARDAKK